MVFAFSLLFHFIFIYSCGVGVIGGALGDPSKRLVVRTAHTHSESGSHAHT